MTVFDISKESFWDLYTLERRCYCIIPKRRFWLLSGI